MTCGVMGDTFIILSKLRGRPERDSEVNVPRVHTENCPVVGLSRRVCEGNIETAMASDLQCLPSQLFDGHLASP